MNFPELDDSPLHLRGPNSAALRNLLGDFTILQQSRSIHRYQNRNKTPIPPSSLITTIPRPKRPETDPTSCVTFQWQACTRHQHRHFPCPRNLHPPRNQSQLPLDPPFEQSIIDRYSSRTEFMHDLLLDNGELLVKFQVHATCVWERCAYSEAVYATTPIATFLEICTCFDSSSCCRMAGNGGDGN